MRWFLPFLLWFAIASPLWAQAEGEITLPAERPVGPVSTSLILTIDGLAPFPAQRPVSGGRQITDLVLPLPRPATNEVAAAIILRPAPRPSTIPDRMPLNVTQATDDQPVVAQLPNLPRACLDQLRTLRVSYTRLPNRQFEGGCHLTDAVEVTSFNGVELSPAGQMTCATAAATAQWLRSSVAPEARARLGKTLSGIDHYSTYSCRTRPSGRLSEHGTGNAIDVAKFHFTDGTVISLDPDWRRGTRAARRFLRNIASASCEFFSVVLTPESDAAHFNHFHFDNGRWRSCDG